MRLYKPTYRHNGKLKKVAKWWIEFRDPNGIVRKWGLGVTDERVANGIAANIGALNEWAKAKIAPADNTVEWVRKQAPKLRKKIEGAGLVPKSQTCQSKPLKEHVKEFRNWLSTNNGEAHVATTIRQVEKIIKGCGFQFWADVDPLKINDYLNEHCENDFSRHTGHHYIASIRQFCRWMVEKAGATKAPPIQQVSFDKTEQRAFEPEEFRRLLEVTRRGPVLSGMTGYERYLLYRLAIETGLRREELKTLTPTSFDFDNLTVFVKGKDTKSKKGYGRDALQSITPETAALMKEFIKGKTPNVRLFKIPNHSARMIRLDCEAAGIETENDRGRIKFHSLRHTCATFLAARGVQPKVLMEIMRHTDINLTLSYYTHTFLGSKAKAVSLLRDIEQAPAKEKTA